MGKRKLVLVGNGMAGVRCLEEILKIDPERFEITIIGREPHPNYNRILLSKVLQGDTSIADITLNDGDWYERHHIQLITGETAVKLDVERKIVYTNAKRKVEYDDLIIATGSLPFMLPLPGADKPGVTAFRDIQDCQSMIRASKTYKKAIVIGGGLLGLEAARGLLNLGMEVHVVHIFDYIMERQLDPIASKMLQRELEKQGMHFLLKKHTEKILGKKRVEGLRFTDGTEIAADLVVMAVGIRPNVDLARGSGLEVSRGIVVNDYLQTTIPSIYAVGECAEHRGMVYGLVAPIYEQGKILAQKICGIEGNPYEGSILSTQLKVSGVDVFSAGEFMEREDTRSLVMMDETQGIYKKVLMRDQKVIGSVLFGDISLGGSLLGIINRKANVSELKRIPIFPSQGDAGESLAASMSNHEVVCACNHVTKGSIVQAVGKEGLTSVEQVKQCTKASSSCGGCQPIVSAILEYVLENGEVQSIEEKKETICGCTSFSHEDISREIKENSFTSAQSIMAALDWKDKDGCTLCRQALNYYISVFHPEAQAMEEPTPDNCEDSSCSLGQPDGEDLGKALHHNFSKLRTPYRIEMKVSSCPCHGAESMIQDFGAVGVPGGWDVYVGGHGGAHIRIGQLLCTVPAKEDVLDTAGAFLQYYRETAYYAERTSEWVERIGLESIREILFTPEIRMGLLKRANSLHSTATDTKVRVAI